MGELEQRVCPQLLAGFHSGDFFQTGRGGRSRPTTWEGLPGPVKKFRTLHTKNQGKKSGTPPSGEVPTPFPCPGGGVQQTHPPCLSRLGPTFKNPCFHHVATIVGLWWCPRTEKTTLHSSRNKTHTRPERRQVETIR